MRFDFHSRPMKRYHVVAVAISGYRRLASYEAMAEAIKDILGRSLRSYGVVMRDGTTGKRYTVAECRLLEKNPDVGPHGFDSAACPKYYDGCNCEPHDIHSGVTNG